MLRTKTANSFITRRQAGDTIVEVLIAIGVAAFALGTSFAIANHSLQQAITSRERNTSVNIIQSQITALKVRYNAEKNDFRSDDASKGFVVTGGAASPATPTSPPITDYHFCLDELASSNTDPDHTWARIENTAFKGNDAAANNISSSNSYNSKCIKNDGTTDYFVDISAMVTYASKDATYRTVYKVTVRWNQAGAAGQAQSVAYYRI